MNERDFEGDGQRFQFSFRKRESMKEKRIKKNNNNNLANLGKCEILLIEHVLSIHKATNKKH